MPYDIPSWPRLAFPPPPISCLPRALGLSWASYARHFRQHSDADFTRLEAGSVLGGAILRQYFGTGAGYRRRRVYLRAGWGRAETGPEDEVLEGMPVDDSAVWVVDKKGGEGVEEEEEGVVQSVEVPATCHVHTILMVVTHLKFMAMRDRKQPNVLPLMGPGLVVDGREVTAANVVLLTGEQPPTAPQFEFYRLDVEGPQGSSLVPALGTKEEMFGTNTFSLAKKTAEQADKMWKAAAAGELKTRGKLQKKGSPAPSLSQGVADAVKNRKRKLSSRALSAEATDAEEAEQRDAKKRKTAQAKQKRTNKATPAASFASSINTFASTAGTPSAASTSLSQQERVDTPQPAMPTAGSALMKRKRAATLDSEATFSPAGTTNLQTLADPRKKRKISATPSTKSAHKRPVLARPFACTFPGCESRYTTKDSVRRHYKTAHEGH